MHHCPRTLYYSSLWKRVIAWGQSRAANGYGIIWGDARRKSVRKAGESYGVDCSGDCKVLTKLQIATIGSKLLF